MKRTSVIIQWKQNITWKLRICLKIRVTIKSAVSISTSNREVNNFEQNQEKEYKPPNDDHQEWIFGSFLSK